MQQIEDTAVTNSDLSVPAASVARPSGNIRWGICALLFFGTAINYIDRQILGILKPLLSHDLHWSNTSYGNIVAVFQFTYAFGYLFGGRLMDAIGVKKGYPLIATVWSIAAAAHGFARTAFGFTAARFVLGGSEGGNFPAAIRTVCEWFPLKERAFATGVFNSASNLGAIICPLTVPLLAKYAGWPMAFFVTGALGLIWVLAWVMLYNPPETSAKLSASERQYIEDGNSTADVSHGFSWLRLLRSRPALAYTLANIFASPVWWFYLFWIPDFLSKRFNLNLIQVGDYTAVIYAISILGSVGGGCLSQRLLSIGWDLNRARKTSLLIPACCVIPVCLAATVPSVWAAVLIVGLAAAAHQAWSANIYTFVSDTMPKSAVSSVVGMGGLTSGLAGMVVAAETGRLLDAVHTYVPLFIWASTMYLLSLAIINALVPRIERDHDLEAEAAASSSAKGTAA